MRQKYLECFKKIKKDCFKYISSQETNTYKFLNRDRMLIKYLIPISFWISKKINLKKKPLIISLSGGQGTGKTTISSLIKLILEKYFKVKVLKVSIDDFYKTRKERLKLSKKIHPLLSIRGVPGTHDKKMLFNFFKRIKNKKFKSFKSPKFEKSIDDRCKKNQWYKINTCPDIIIFEGWCIGAKSQPEAKLKKPINNMEKNKDKKLIWRKFVNKNLKFFYKKLYNQINYTIFLKAKNFSQLQKWRIKQEKKLKLKFKHKKNLKIMKNHEVINFMETYQRITESMFVDSSKYSSIILNLSSNHQIDSLKYNYK